MESLLLIRDIFLLIISFFSLVIVLDYFWRLKYIDKETGRYKCGICNKVPPIIYLFDTMFSRAYRCKKHSIKGSTIVNNINSGEEDIY